MTYPLFLTICFRIAHTDGSLLAFYGPSEKEAHVHLAIVANSWSVYEKNGHVMKSILIDVEN
ncbi:hypothetical protein HMI54_011626 [Coelomomyces lativittatus]|nr:hypothetical protein HMI54_011626 [Coelomomyces lativittatus]